MSDLGFNKDRLKELRIKKGFGLSKDFAEKVGLSNSMYSSIENGSRKPSLAVLATIAKTLNTSTDYLCGLSDDPTPFKYNDNLDDVLRSKQLVLNGQKLSEVDTNKLQELIKFFESNLIK
ncbi:helix-turn-helix transcriptional regulator (plasmid) [Bacillus carboniphilus]|uniref:Helix-turn-helix transcriptional regulator n=1 Tax=Bacillus carboniphilus TaxID=86663 RepID=A0ABY9K0Z0_9BACI|nr:helix-turn-helix transcriptional regulator [Bacillus carboniphilus]WLR44507.1 helix-turn-helix transcriptional regulator [Bacillus carboniphilus]